MKKKIAIALSVFLLLAAGFTFTEIKIKEKKDKEKIEKDKEKIEKELKEILIPNAEKELKELLKQNSDLKDSISNVNDSIAYYNDFLKQQEQMYSGFADDDKYYPSCIELCEALGAIRSDWYKKAYKMDDVFKKAGVFKYQKITLAPKYARDYMAYLQYGMIKHLYEVDSFSIPGEFDVSVECTQVFLGSHGYEYTDVEQVPLFTGLGNYENQMSKYTGKVIDDNDFSGLSCGDLLDRLKYALQATLVPIDDIKFTDGYTGWLRQYDEPEDILKVVQAVNIFLDNIDNSKKVINQETLNKAKRISKQLLAYCNDQVKISRNIDNTNEKISNLEKTKTKFKNSETQVQQLVQDKEEILSNYKKPNAVQIIYNQRQRN